MMFTLRGVRVAVVGQEFWRGVRGAADDARRAAAARARRGSSGRNRRRYGGYLVHAGVAVLFLGVAASSAFIDQRDVRLRPGRHAGRRLRRDLRQADRHARRRPAGTGAPISLGAVLDVRRGGKHSTLRPSRNYYPSQDPTRGRDLALLRRRGDQRGRPALGPAQGHLDGRAARPRASLKRAIREGDTRVRRRRPRDVQALVDRRARRALRTRPAAGRVPRDRQAAGDLDLDRRRRSRCSARLIALWPSPRRGAPRARASTPRASGARALARLAPDGVRARA